MNRPAIEQVRAGVMEEQQQTATQSFHLALAVAVLDHEQRIRDIEEALNLRLKVDPEDATHLGFGVMKQREEERDAGDR